MRNPCLYECAKLSRIIHSAFASLRWLKSKNGTVNSYEARSVDSGVDMKSRNTLAKFAVFCTFLGLPAVANGQSPALTIEQIQRAWQERQERFKTVHISWQADSLRVAGSYSQNASAKAKNAEKGKILPPVDHKFTVTNSVFLKGDSYRHDAQGLASWMTHLERFLQQDRILIFDGSTTKEKAKFEGRSYSQAFVQSEGRPKDAQLIDHYPILLSFRPIHKLLRPVVLDEFTLTPGTHPFQGYLCHELTKRIPGQQYMMRLWVDPKHDFIVRHVQVEAGGRLWADLDISYAEVSEVGWTVSAWAFSTYDDRGKLASSARCRVTEQHYNTELPSDTFSEGFDPKTYVVNLAEKERYILKEDGSKRPVSESEYSKDFEELITSEPPSRAKSVSSKAIVIVVASLGLVLSIVFFVRRYLRAKVQ